MCKGTFVSNTGVEHKQHCNHHHHLHHSGEHKHCKHKKTNVDFSKCEMNTLIKDLLENPDKRNNKNLRYILQIF